MKLELDRLRDDPQLAAQIVFLSTIGHVCLQWSLLELTLLALLSDMEGIDLEKGEIIFGGLDIKPRINMAITLGTRHKLPPPMLKELRAVRKVIQDELMDRRNQAVHGAHGESELLGTYNLRMSRWPAPKKLQPVSYENMIALTEEINAVQRRVYAVLTDMVEWQAKRAASARS